jgi:hypothetical protein
VRSPPSPTPTPAGPGGLAGRAAPWCHGASAISGSSTSRPTPPSPRSTGSSAPRCSKRGAGRGDRSLYRHRNDLVAGLRRKLDFAGAIRLEGLTLVDVVVTPVEGGTLIRIEAELAASRANVLAGSAAAGAGTTVVTGLIGAIIVEPALVIASLPAGLLVGGGGARVATARWQRRRDDVAEVLAGLLDTLEDTPRWSTAN